MIRGKDFIWLHFPKCAGSFTENLLRRYFESNQDILFDTIDYSNVIWHQNCQKRERAFGIELPDENIVCNIRRLPYWIISRVLFEKNRSEVSLPRAYLLNGYLLESDGLIAHADNYINTYTQRPVRHWIRQEQIKTDFYSAFSNYLDVSLIPVNEFDQFINSLEYDHEIKNWFSYYEMKHLYKSCPKWTQLELLIYGNLLIDTEF